MSANSKAKLKLLYIRQMLEEETDSDHGLSMAQIIERLAQEGIDAERKSIYRDLEILREFGLDIRTYQRNPVEYALEHRDFTLSELMLMVDAVASSRFLTIKQANMLLANIRSLASSSQQEKLDRRIHVVGRIARRSDCVFEVIDEIHQAIREKKKIEFQYLRFGADGKRHPAHKGRIYELTPVGISYDSGFYYVTCWSDRHEDFTEFRIDRMGKVRVSDEQATRNAQIAQYSFDRNDYEFFGRFDGPRVTVILSVEPERIEIITDQFGSNAELFKEQGQIHARVKVRVSPQFFGWVAGMGNMVKIVGPRDLIADYKAYLSSLIDAC